MNSSPERGPIESSPEKEKPVFQETSKRLRDFVDVGMGGFIKEFHVEGKEGLIAAQEENPDTEFVITGSHLSNLDALGAVKALGDRLNIQIAVESMLFDRTPQNLMMQAAGKDNFSPIEYRKTVRNKTGVFDPENFDELLVQMEKGKTPWIAIHPFTIDEVMKKARIGPIYLAQKSGAKIIPTALEVKGTSINLEGLAQQAKGVIDRLRGKTSAVFHVGEILDLPKVDVAIIEEVLRKRAEGQTVSPEEKQKFKEVTSELRSQANMVAEKIAAMLPEEQRGFYAKKGELIDDDMSDDSAE